MDAATKKKYSTFYNRREELSVTFNKLICLNDRILIAPKLRSAVLQDLHSLHLGVEKMKSLARLTCYWPELNEDIKALCCRLYNRQDKHKVALIKLDSLASCVQMLPTYANYAGPFGEFYAFIVTNAYSKWPEIFSTKTANATFT